MPCLPAQPTCSSAAPFCLALALTLASPALAGGVVMDNALTSLYAALLGGGRVTFADTANLSFSLIAPLEIQADTTFDASPNRVTITFSGADQTRLFNVHPGVTLTLLNLTLTDGLSTNGAAVFNQGTVVATNCVFQNHTAAGLNGAAGSAGNPDIGFGWRGSGGGDGGLAQGGAIFNLGTLRLVACRFVGNRAEGGNGGNGGAGGNGGMQGGQGGDGGEPGLAQGGAVFNTGTMHAQECTFTSNRAAAGTGGSGGASGAGGADAATLPGFSRAGAPAAGGALFTTGQATFLACTFHTNTVSGGLAADEYTGPTGWGRVGRAGGAAHGGAVANEGSLQFTNCTFAANAATGGAGGDGGDGTTFRAGKGGEGGDALGGALWSRSDALAINCTFVGGSAAGGAGGAAGDDIWDFDSIDPQPGRPGLNGGGNIARTDGTLALHNCLVANSVSGGNGYGGCQDDGYNLSSDDTLGFSALGSLNQTDPRVGNLGDYGGATQTIPLLANSPAIDAAETIPGLATDQRGTTRPQGTAFDIGAFERPFAGLAGRVTRADGTAFPGVTLTLLSATARPTTTTTDAGGTYQFVPLPDVDLGVYRIAAPTNGPAFTPAYRAVQLTSPSQSVTGLDFVASPGRILSFGFNGTAAFQFRFQGEPQQHFRIEASHAFEAWQEIGQATTDAAGLFDFSDPTLPPPDLRFYRVVSP